MSGVDVAVQLRAFDAGESSGIIPQLLASDVPTLVSPIGAMRDFGAAVRYVPQECDATQLAEVILEEAREPARGQADRDAYAQAHTPARFCLALLDLLEGKRPTPPVFTSAVAPGPLLPEPIVPTPEPAHWPHFERILEEIGAAQNPYVQSHLLRYRHTLAALERWLPNQRDAALEIGTSWLFAILLKAEFGFSTVDVTDRDPGTDAKIVTATFPSAGALRAFNLDLESDPIPAADAQYDLVLCCEVLEHLDVDPMFMLAEINRTMKLGGRLLLTTPNVTSARNVLKILNGYAPHFYMQYRKDRSPYRHNIEYAPDQVSGLIEAAGYRIDQLWTLDTFEAPVLEAIDLLRRLQYPTTLRGDNMFAVATKTGPVIERHPPVIYV
jgi:SAM-dependent methyltransferase